MRIQQRNWEAQRIWLWNLLGFDHRIYTGLGEKTLGGHKTTTTTTKTLCAPGTRRKEQCPHKRLSQTYLWVFRSLQWRLQLIVWPQAKKPRGNMDSTINKKIGIKIYWLWSNTRNWSTQFLQSQSLPSGSFHKPLIFINQMADRKKQKSQKTDQTNNMDHSLV